MKRNPIKDEHKEVSAVYLVAATVEQKMCSQNVCMCL